MPVPGSPEIAHRLLDLFPAAVIRQSQHFVAGMTKDEAIQAIIASGTGTSSLPQFLQANFGYLHQHVYVFDRSGGGQAIDQDQAFAEAPVVIGADGSEIHHYYLLELTYNLIIESPLEHVELQFLRPVKLVTASDHFRVHFTIMAKNPRAYLEGDRRVVRSSPHPTEEILIAEFQATGAGTFGRMDINHGIKDLWEADEFDAPSVQYKRALATSKDVMDEDFTVKKDDPNLYKVLRDKPLFGTTFRFLKQDPCIDYFIAVPTEGRLTFRRYSSSSDCVDNVVRQIIQAN